MATLDAIVKVRLPRWTRLYIFVLVVLDRLGVSIDINRAARQIVRKSDIGMEVVRNDRRRR